MVQPFRTAIGPISWAIRSAMGFISGACSSMSRRIRRFCQAVMGSVITVRNMRARTTMVRPYEGRGKDKSKSARYVPMPPDGASATSATAAPVAVSGAAASNALGQVIRGRPFACLLDVEACRWCARDSREREEWSTESLLFDCQLSRERSEVCVGLHIEQCASPRPAEAIRLPGMARKVEQSCRWRKRDEPEMSKQLSIKSPVSRRLDAFQHSQTLRMKRTRPQTLGRVMPILQDRAR